MKNITVLFFATLRDTGVFGAARYGIDRLKQIIPVWKKEVEPNGEEWGRESISPPLQRQARTQSNLNSSANLVCTLRTL